MKNLARNFLLFALMLAASGLAVALRPTQMIADQAAPINLEAMIPKTFGGWIEEAQNNTLIIDPQQKETLDRIYTQTLSRTFTNANGARIMLSIAYGKDQGDANQVHSPEICYPAQGFTLKNRQHVVLETGTGTIPAIRVETAIGQRNEPVTYWITVGEKVIGSSWDMKLTQLSYGLQGKIPDGILFRVSSIDKDPGHAYEAQKAFIGQLLAALDPQSRQKFIGNPNREQQ
jgi:EpsI family protein